ncbi:ribosome small subunit-dependent GTPase A [Synechococcus sp. PCC 7502]|uniref:ribosome small subunit-dependent GTPase A n=1 Tax=Synechococcus sp. PCC 7502 TaxID=1173263 RepID=UPI00029FA36A|nr:ribosome small subunit-dependent GTPase A [Synechococcus sp. PCC 7502]AFY74597.1 ribosome small subunit-dependent GTPase A [Synechococcus sp. PCC 7502]
MITGTVLAIQANYYRVGLDLIPEVVYPCAELLCIRRARLKKTGQAVYVGDRIEVEEPDWQGARGAISGVFPRRNLLERPMVANVDRVVLAFALAEPEIDPYQLSRFLVNLASQDLEVLLCFTKRDLVTVEFWQAWCDRLVGWGYKPLAVSVNTGEGLEELRQYLSEGVTVVTGQSGVGKSSLINFLIPNLNIRVHGVSLKLGTGRHTTRHVELFPIGDRGLLADTPGFTQPTLHCDPLGLIDCFPEVQNLKHSCQFRDCLHLNEPECGIRGDWERYEHYCLFIEEAFDYKTAQEAIATADKSLKSKSGQGGTTKEEPRLVTKSHRRRSRRSNHQQLDTSFQEDLD